MTKSSASMSFLMIAMVCCFLMATTAQGTISPWLNRPQQFNRFFLARPLPSENNFQLDNDYNGRLLEEIPTEMVSNGPEARAPGRFNRPSAYSSSGDSSSSGERTFQTFANLFASRQLCPACPGCPSCPSCPACPSPTCPVCQACPTCPVVPVIPAQSITLSPAVGECFATTILSTASAAPCSRVSAAPRGTIDVTFSDTGNWQTATIGIVAVAPNTQIQLTCTAIPIGTSAVAKTQVGAITANVPITSNGYLQIFATGAGSPATAIKLTCSWISS
ncbi:uncharacterized protein LOC124205606 [Daphnia pulex]|uniref:uncharacterized protein LOC124205606 n=1 Tax=Daphnia pulex TaxID=6669 RepID=UPI001EDE021F|nr:uncharacterized protein LOC124205606 [Daphnia pulex]